MRVSRTILGGAVAAVVGGLVVGGLVVGGAPHYGETTLSVAKPPPPPPPSVGCAMDSGYWVCASSGGVVKAQPPPPTSLGCSAGAVAGENSEVCGGVKATSVVVAGPPFPYPFSIGPAKPPVAGQPAPKARPILLMQLSAGLATAPASPIATVLLSDWPAAGKGTVFVSLYQGDNADACASPPVVTKTATAAYRGAPATWAATFPGLGVGSYEAQATFFGANGPMSTPCGRAALKVVAAPGSGQ